VDNHCPNTSNPDSLIGLTNTVRVTFFYFSNTTGVPQDN
jgi:hypothetical protein